MSKRKSKKQSGTQRILWLLSLVMVASMVISLVIVALPSAPPPTPTPFPTFTPFVRPTATPSPTPTVMPPSSPTVPPPTPTAPLPTATSAEVLPSPTVTATLSITFSVPSGPTAPPAATEPPATPTPVPTAPPAPTPTGSPSPTAAPQAAATPTSTPQSLTFAVCGDSRGNPAVYGQVLASVAASGSQFLIHTGDLVNEGSEALWQEFEAIMAGFPLPFYPVPGNHDGLGGAIDGYLAYSGAPAAHYAFDAGPVHFTLADSHNGGATAAELTWLRQDLAATSQPLKMVILHHPAFDPDGTDHIMAFGNRAFQDLMVEQGVDYVFAGHIHAYASEERDGVLYTYTGGAGAPLYTSGHPQSFYHYLLVTVDGAEVTIETVKI